MKSSLVLVSLLIFLSGCFASGSLDRSKESLGETASLYYNLLMWKYYDRASAFVDEEKKDKYEKFVSESEDDLNITSYEIKEVTLEENGNGREGLVRVLISYYKYPSVSEKRVTLEDKWIQNKKKWYVYSDFEGEIFK